MLNKDAKRFYWITLGVRAYHHIVAGNYATASHLIRQGVKAGVFEDASSWRTSVLLHYKWEQLGG